MMQAAEIERFQPRADDGFLQSRHVFRVPIEVGLIFQAFIEKSLRTYNEHQL
jgi:hypothetical protein